MTVEEWVAKIEVKASKISPRQIQSRYDFGRACIGFGYILMTATLAFAAWRLWRQDATTFFHGMDVAYLAATISLFMTLGIYMKTFAAACLVLKTRQHDGHALPETTT